MEIYLGDFDVAVGGPWMIPHAGVWSYTLSKDELGHIKNLVIHGTPTDQNIAALPPDIRKES